MPGSGAASFDATQDANGTQRRGGADIDFDGLKDYLTATFVKTQTIRYEIRYRHVSTNENKRVYVEYTYSASYRIPGLKGEEWKHTVADNRLELVPEGEGYKILAGM